MHRYCTYFDHRFSTRGVAMIRSLRRFEPDCQVTVLCLSEECAEAMMRLSAPGVSLLRLADFERDNPDLLAVRPTRSLRDYYFTMSGCLLASLLRGVPSGETLTYLDADLFFYSSPVPLHKAMGEASIGLVAHRYHWWAKRLEKYGRFNVGWVSFRADNVGLVAAHWWRNSCIDWCYGMVDGDRFADQKYLDHIHAKFPKVVEITHPGANVGPWNICRHSLKPGEGDSFVVDGKFPLIFFHFAGLTKTAADTYLCSNVSYLGPFTPTVRNWLYRPYLAKLESIRRELGLPPEQDVREVRGAPPRRRRMLAPALRLASLLAGHYVREGA